MLFGGIDNVILIVISVLIGLMRCIPMFFEERKSTTVGRFFQTVDGIWMWASLMFLIDVVLIYVLNSFITLPKFIVYILLAIVPVLGVYNYYNATKLIVNSKILEFDNLNRNINIVHMSDVHFGSVRHKQIISQIAEKLKELEDSCQIAIISGDLADGSSVVEPHDFEGLKDVKMPIVFTPGNHDFYMGIENVIEACQNAGIIVLDNDNFEFENLNIYGLTYSFDDIPTPTPDEIKNSLNPNLINIINYHVPYNWE